MADIITFAKRGAPPDGNGARETLINLANHDTGPCGAAEWADWVLMHLWLAGYKVVPLD